MRTSDFVGRVQLGAGLSSRDQALMATRATLETLAERLGAEESHHLAAQLPEDIGRYLDGREGDAERFSTDEFLKRVGTREGVDPPKAATHARAVLGTVSQAVPAAEMRDVLGRLPADYANLFARIRTRRRRFGAGF